MGLTIALCVFCSAPAALGVPMARAGSLRPLLDDGVVLSGVQGRVIASTQTDTWHLELTQDVNHSNFRIPTKTRFELLPCTALEAVIADVNDRPDAHFRMWARVTQYKGREYLFPTYYLPAVRAGGQGEPDREPAEATQSQPGGDKDELGIPRAVLERVKAKPPSAAWRPLQARPQGSESGQPRPECVIHAVGRFEPQGDHIIFAYDAVGRRVQQDRFIVLPSMALELAEHQIAAEPDPVRFSVAGIATQFKGKSYLLLQRATRAYGHGNLGR